MEVRKELIVSLLVDILKPTAIILKNDSAQRQIENLSQETELVYGQMPEKLVLIENGVSFRTDLLMGQKTGWFYDHRLSRSLFADWSKGKTVLDLFSYMGAWGILAASKGASHVTCVDSSAPALMMAQESAKDAGLDQSMEFIKKDVFDCLKEMRETGRKFDAIVLDPPALIKRKKDFKTGYEAYKRLNQMALQILNPNGLLVSASCSHHLSQENLKEILRSSARHIDRHLVYVAAGGQGPDHPIHPAMPETEYLKTFFCRVTGSL
jgi:23S rRNA (cytosine1962-C5)-methyltransferase